MTIKGKTFFTHRSCNGGSILLDLSNTLKMVAPSFSTSPSGFSNLVVDLDNRSNIQPQYVVFSCSECNNVLPKESYDDDIMGACSCCNDKFPVKDLFVTDRLPAICINCVSNIKEKRMDSQLDMFCSLFGMTNKTNFVPMRAVIDKPISM